MTYIVPETARAVLDAVEQEEGPMAPKKRLTVIAALECFAEAGFDGTSTKMIAQRAGIAEATIFRHFPSKHALLMRIATPVVRHVLAPAAGQQALDLMGRANANPRDILTELIKSRLAFFAAYAPLVRILLQEVLVNDELRQVVAAEIEQLLRDVSHLIAGFGPKDPLDQERIIRTMAGMMIGYFAHRTILHPDRDWDDAAEIEFMVSSLLAGMDLSRG